MIQLRHNQHNRIYNSVFFVINSSNFVHKPSVGVDVDKFFHRWDYNVSCPGWIQTDSNFFLFQILQNKIRVWYAYFNFWKVRTYDTRTLNKVRVRIELHVWPEDCQLKHVALHVEPYCSLEQEAPSPQSSTRDVAWTLKYDWYLEVRIRMPQERVEQ